MIVPTLEFDIWLFFPAAQALIDEDRLLSRLEMLEGQLQVYQKKDEDSLREELVALQEDKSNYETTAKVCQATYIYLLLVVLGWD